MTDDWTEADDAIEEVRAIRRRIWEEFDYDPKKLIAHFRELENQYQGPVISLPEKVNPAKPAA